MQTGDTAPTAGSVKSTVTLNGLRIKNPARYLAGLNVHRASYAEKKIIPFFITLSGNS
jgi:hypothetical protein